MFPGGAWATAVLTVLLILAAAKAHGRQVRLARERLGIASVDFRADNGPVVEALWRRDRIRFWVGFATVAVLGVAASLLLDPVAGWPRWVAALVWLPWAFAAGFVGAGLAAWAGQLRRRDGDPGWMGRANLGSAGWWLLVAAAAALVWLSVAP